MKTAEKSERAGVKISLISESETFAKKDVAKQEISEGQKGLWT
jgi:hypothetical protein